LRRFLRWLIGAPVFILVMVFAVANRKWVFLSLDPLNETAPALALEMPIWMVLFVGIFIGIIVGWFYCWRAQGKWRRLAKERQAEIARLQSELLVNRDGPEKVQAHMLAPLPGLMP
jgi:uncharacterized integral membrane protein